MYSIYRLTASSLRRKLSGALLSQRDSDGHNNEANNNDNTTTAAKI